MIDIPGLIELVRQGLVQADSDSEGTPDYDVLAETAVRIVLEQVAKDVIIKAVEGGR